jgi:hypothetical protein
MEVILVDLKLRMGHSEDRLIPINIIEIQNMYKNGRLKNATVFGYLFGLNDLSLFKQNVKVIIDLVEYDITYEDWILLYGFLRTGEVTPLLELKDQKKKIEDCYKTTLKLGGLPSFDLYYDRCAHSLNEGGELINHY